MLHRSPFIAFAVSLISGPPLNAAIGVGGIFAMTGVLALLAIGVVRWLVPEPPAPGEGRAAAGDDDRRPVRGRLHEAEARAAVALPHAQHGAVLGAQQQHAARARGHRKEAAGRVGHELERRAAAAAHGALRAAH